MTSGAGSMSYLAIKTAAAARDADKKRDETIQRSVLCLMADYLDSKGYYETLIQLRSETGPALEHFTVADNVNLPSIIQEYETFQQVRLGTAPKIIKRVVEFKSKIDKGKYYADKQRSKSAAKPKPNGGFSTENSNLSRGDEQPNYQNQEKNNRSNSLTPISEPLPKLKRDRSITESTENLDLNVTSTRFNENTYASSRTSSGITRNKSEKPKSEKQKPEHQNPTNQKPSPSKPRVTQNNKYKEVVDIQSLLRNAIVTATEQSIPNTEGASISPDEKLLKPLGANVTDEYRNLAQTISRDIYLESPNVQFSDIVGLEDAKRLVRESVVFPIKYPQLFEGSPLLKPWKGLLLYGPPGTGKTMLAKAIATECKTTFFNISASSIVSKWRGDSEKLIRVLFELARHHAPSTIFIDEIDSIMSARDGHDHEGSRRMKTELLVQMDGLISGGDNVFVLAASNLPWSLDIAMLRRLEKRIFVDLPSFEARKSLFTHYLKDGNAIKISREIDYELLSNLTKGYSGSDVYMVCREAAMTTLRKIFNVLECESEDITDLDSIKLETIDQECLLNSVEKTQAATCGSDKFEKWSKSFAST
jgi:katanin p60 ATPase-containing subunit A1